MTLGLYYKIFKMCDNYLKSREKFCMKTPLIVIVYDSIHNSVFEGQVLAPLVTHEAPHRPVIIISYETKKPAEHLLLKINLAHPNISLIIFKRWPLFDKLTSMHNVSQLSRFLRPLAAYTLRARGPIAGNIALKAKTANCHQLTIQARGLLAEEYAFSNRTSYTLLKKIYHFFFARYEKETYQAAVKAGAIIEAVSPALQEHLMQAFELPESATTVAAHDTPAAIPLKTKLAWRQEVRQELNIPETASVYCYNGSIKAWQCPHEALAYFYARYKEDTHAFLLILTQDVKEFNELIAAYKLPETAYAVRSVPHASIYKYLAAADHGLVFREPHVINWTSRPTKILEYQAVGLNIVHNNTIAYLQPFDSAQGERRAKQTNQQ